MERGESLFWFSVLIENKMTILFKLHVLDEISSYIILFMLDLDYNRLNAWGVNVETSVSTRFSDLCQIELQSTDVTHPLSDALLCVTSGQVGVAIKDN